ncbi:MAG: SufE family protein [Tepidiformaceae bacterium]
MPAELPQPLADLVADFAFVERGDRMLMLIEFADRFQDVPSAIATRPFAEENRVTRCESEAYVWAEDRPDGTLKFHFAVENPQGLSAKAFSVIVDETLSGQPLEEVVNVPGDVIFTLFGKDLSMGKGEGLLGILGMVQANARRRLAARRAAAEAGQAS